MPYIKVPEFKPNEVISSDDFNDAFQVFTDIKLDANNFSDESFGFDQITAGTSLTDASKISVSSDTHASTYIDMQRSNYYDPFKYPAPTYLNERERHINHPGTNRIALQNLVGGEKFIIRASCTIKVNDGGWRTYYHGIPPYFKIGLVRFPGELSITSGTKNTATAPIKSTEAHYRVAFTGKVPSASSLLRGSGPTALFDGNYRDRTNGAEWQFRDTRGGTADVPEDDESAHNPVYQKKYMPFEALHSYTTTYLYEHESGNSSQSFGLMCFFGGQYHDVGPTTERLKTGGTNGCRPPSRDERAYVKDLHIHCYQVKK